MTSQQTDINWRDSKAWQNWWKKFSPIEKFGIRLAVFAVFIGILGYLNQHAGFAAGITLLCNLFGDFYANVSSELISVVITILVLDRLNSRRQNEQELTRLKALLASNERAVTGIAVAELRARGWLSDGSLRSSILDGANLHKFDLIDVYAKNRYKNANFTEVSLKNADLSESTMWNINFQRANLIGANFHLSQLNFANLKCVDLTDVNLQGANLNFAKLQFAAFEKAQLQGANLEMANLTNADMAKVICDETTVLPDGTHWTPDTDWSKFGAVEIGTIPGWLEHLRKHGLVDENSKWVD